MSTATATASRQATSSIEQFARDLKHSDPDKAIDLIIAETERQRSEASAKEAEYRALSELEFGPDGQIVKANMAGLWRLAQSYTKSMSVPSHYRTQWMVDKNDNFVLDNDGKKIWQDRSHDCFIACQLAFRWRLDPLMVMQCSYIVHGKPGIEGKLVTALINSSGKIKGRVRYKFSGEGKSRSCTAYATDKETGEVLESTVTWAMVEAEGWLTKPGSKWKTIPDLMFTYRSATFLGRQYFPEVLLGMRTTDELQDTEDETRPTSRPAKTLDDIADRFGNDVERDEDDAPRRPSAAESLGLPKAIIGEKVIPQSPKLSEGEIDPSRSDESQWKPPAFDLEAIGADFAACETLTEVNKLTGEIGATVPADHKAAVAQLEEQARDRVRAKHAAKNRQTTGAT